MRRAIVTALGLAWIVGGVACSTPSRPMVGGESHWLAECGDDAQCGDDLNCVCGTCTRACAEDATCAGGRDAACYDPSSPLLLRRCEDLGSGESSGVCLPQCSRDSDCGTTRTCMQGACVPKNVAPDIEWSAPVELPKPQTVIEGGDDSIVGVWRERDCNVAAPKGSACIQLLIERNQRGDLVGSVLLRNESSNTTMMSGPFAPVTNPDLGYPTEIVPDHYSDIPYGGLKDMPYRILDGHVSGGRFSFSWSAYDLWHDWCAMQTPYPWQVGDRQFYFCVPQDQNARASIDRGKLALCTSAEFLELCPAVHSDTHSLIPCVCDTWATAKHRDAALCSPAYCHCDAKGCDLNNAISYAFVDLSVGGDEMTGTWQPPDPQSPYAIAFERGEP